MAGKPTGSLAGETAWYQPVLVVIVFFTTMYSSGEKSQFHLIMFLMKEQKIINFI